MALCVEVRTCVCVYGSGQSLGFVFFSVVFNSYLAPQLRDDAQEAVLVLEAQQRPVRVAETQLDGGEGAVGVLDPVLDDEEVAYFVVCWIVCAVK